MNQALLKSFAPAARIKFREAMAQRAALLGLSRDNPPILAQRSGPVVYIGGVAMPIEWEDQRQKLAERIKKQGWDHVIDEAAYTWFNRFSAIRYMEVHGFISQGLRVLTPAVKGSQPEILVKAQTIHLPGIKKEKIIELKLDGTKDEELYRLLILAICENFHNKLPLLFPGVQEDQELLLPTDLLRSGSLLDWFVEGLPDDEWQEIEVLGWLYQYYISDLKAEYMARKTAYKKEEIPAVTQLFTPKWIVQYLVQNSLGRSWLLHHPDSGLKSKMAYYIESAPQEPEVEAELKRLFSGALNPEDIRFLDPAMGSGHILVTAYETLREIYLERGYQRQQCARLILEKNLYGLDIDLRATEIACFALIMKAREDDPEILANGSDVHLNLLSFRDCSAMDREGLLQSLNPQASVKSNLTELLALFEQGTLFGSLIQIPEGIVPHIKALKIWLENIVNSDTLLASEAAEEALYYVRLAEVLGQKYDQVVSNPPYMGTKGMNEVLKSFVERKYKNGKSDLFASFILRGFDWLKDTGSNAMVTMQSWMFLSSYEAMRVEILDKHTLITMAHLGARAFRQISGEVVQTTAFSFLKYGSVQYKPVFFRLIEGDEEDKESALLKNQFKHEQTKQIDFCKIPGRPIAYWLGNKVIDKFKNGELLGSCVQVRGGMTTANNDRFVRMWFEVNGKKIVNLENRKKKWCFYNKGGEYRKWFGNRYWIVDWEDNGKSIKQTGLASVRSEELYFTEMVGWTDITSFSQLGVRYYGTGFIFDASGPAVFPNTKINYLCLLGFLGSKLVSIILQALNPTLHVQAGNIASLPWIEASQKTKEELQRTVLQMIDLSKSDYYAFETSWDFQSLPWLPQTLISYIEGTEIASPKSGSLESSWLAWRAVGQTWTSEMKKLEEENNHLFIDAYGLQDELTPDVPIEQITLTVNPAYRYKVKKSRKKTEGEEELVVEENDDTPMLDPAEGERRMREDGAKELISYVLGCLMGRYSLDIPGLAYAEAGGVDFDTSRYATFPADDDGIVPITDMPWFESDAALKIKEFVGIVWGKENLDRNLTWLADGLGAKANETPLETIRRYLSMDFYKNHLSVYKRRPIYWKFSSGKEKAFEALVYLHRYNEATLSRMRMQFVVPLVGSLRSRIAEADVQLKGAESTAERKRIEKALLGLQKKQAELAVFEALLRHYADQAIALDLDDGVRVNYGKFGELLANVKDVCGKEEE